MSKQRKRGLSPVFAVIILLFVAVACIGSSFFILQTQKTKLAEIESKLPESAISAYLKQVKSNDFDSIYENSLMISPHLNSKEDYIAEMKKIYGEVNLGKLTYEKVKGEDNLYYIIEGNKLISELQLIPSDGKWIANTIFKGDNDYKIQVPTDLKLEINGLKVDDSYITQKEVTPENFSGLSDKSGIVLVNTYEINNLISEPEISVENGNYSYIQDSLNKIYYIGSDETNNSELVKAVENAAVTIAKYPTRDTSLGAVGAVTVKNSDFYKRISSLDNQWYAVHGTASFSNINVSKIIKQSDDTMVANISLDFYVASSSASKTYNIGYQLTFVNTGGSWKIAGIVVDNDLNPANKQ